MSNRVVYLDVIRGFAILLVVIGHLIQYNYDCFLTNPIFNCIYSFHMPLFFFLSGYTTAIKDKQNGFNSTSIPDLTRAIIGKTKHLLLPALAWAVIFCIINHVPPTAGTLFSCYWFLYVLWAIYLFWSCSSFIYCFLGKPIWWPLFCCFIVLIAFVADFKRIPLVYLSTFIYGYIFHIQSCNQVPKYWKATILLVVFVSLVPHYKYGNDVAGDPSRVWLMIPIAAVACPLCLYLSNLFVKLPQAIVNKFSLIGRYSLGIYLIHMVFIRYRLIPWSIQESSIIVQFPILVLLAIAIAYICIGFQHIVQRIPYVSKVLFGK